MYSTPHDNDIEPAIEKGNIVSDTLVLLVTILLLITSVSFPLLWATAETRVSDDQLVVSIADREYDTLLSSLFGRVGRRVPEDVYEYIKDIDEYRVRIAQGIKENNELIQVLYSLTEDFPKGLKEECQEEIDSTKVKAEKLKIAIFPHIESDAFLSEAVTEKYELYLSFTEWLVSQISGRSTVSDLNNIQEESYNLRREITLLYMKINSVTQGDH